MTWEKLLQHYKANHGDLFGITRLNYQCTGKGYWIRLGWKDKLPIYQESVYDKEYSSQEESLKAAIALRDEAFSELADLGIFTLNQARRSRPFLTRLNKTGIPGMTLQRTTSKTGAGDHYSWKVN